MTIRATNNIIYVSGISEKILLSLSTYKDSSVYYRAGDNSFENLEPIFVNISKENHAIVNEASSENYIINGKMY